MSKTGYSNIIVRVERDSATITLNRPDRMNALDAETLRELNVAVRELDEVQALRAIIFTGAGRSFSAGGDLEKYLKLFRMPVEFRAFMEDFYRLFEFMEASGKIYIAAINGICVAGGLELLLACDLVIASDDAKIGDCHLNFSQLPGAGSSVRAWRAIGATRAKHLMLTGALLTAREAERIGLVGEVVPKSKFDAGVKSMVAKLAEKSPVALRGMKHLLNEAIRSDPDRALRNEISFVQHYATNEKDAIAGLLAFQAKRATKAEIKAETDQPGK